jgi:cysteine-rich repeat protein
MHDDVQSNVVPSVRRSGISVPQSTASSTEPIRITLDRTLLDSSTLSLAQRDYVETAAREAADWLEAALLVAPVVGSISVNGTCLSGASVNVTVSSSDVLVLLSAEPLPPLSSTLAWAGYCQIDGFGRPTAGQLNVNPALVDLATPNPRRYVDTLVHELSHLLGFSESAFASYREPLNGALRGLSNVVFDYPQNGKTVSAIITPTVVAAARTRFACPTLVGGEIEDGGGQSAVGSHWEQRIYEGDVMAGVAVGPAARARSALTLALFEDMGWYEVDYAGAEPAPFGHGEGCGFAEQACDVGFGDRYFCDVGSEQGCTPDGGAKGYCSVYTYGGALPAHYQYLPDATQGGIEVADYCPRWTGYSNGDCSDPASLLQPAYGEALGQGTGCFESSLLQDIYIPDGNVRPTCHTMICSGGVLSVSVGAQTKLCPIGGGTLTFSGYTGSLECPPFSDYCNTCGDGVLTHDETCDDGNALSGDGCSSSCNVELGAHCTGFPSVCVSAAAPLPTLSPAMIATLAAAMALATFAVSRQPKQLRRRR